MAHTSMRGRLPEWSELFSEYLQDVAADALGDFGARGQAPLCHRDEKAEHSTIAW